MLPDTIGDFLANVWTVAEIILMSAGFVFFAWGFVRLCIAHFKERGSDLRPTTTGTVVSREVVPQERFLGHVLPPRQAYQAKVVYEYEVDGKTYASDALSFIARPSWDKQSAQTTVDRYPPGTTVEVFYSPDDPSQAVLRPGIDGMSTVVIIFFGGLVWVFGYWLWAVLPERLERLVRVWDLLA